jgi:hypothetical protein
LQSSEVSCPFIATTDNGPPTTYIERFCSVNS